MVFVGLYPVILVIYQQFCHIFFFSSFIQEYFFISTNRLVFVQYKLILETSTSTLFLFWNILHEARGTCCGEGKATRYAYFAYKFWFCNEFTVWGFFFFFIFGLQWICGLNIELCATWTSEWDIFNLIQWNYKYCLAWRIFCLHFDWVVAVWWHFDKQQWNCVLFNFCIELFLFFVNFVVVEEWQFWNKRWK